jgi:hypothetical protein
MAAAVLGGLAFMPVSLAAEWRGPRAAVPPVLAPPAQEPAAEPSTAVVPAAAGAREGVVVPVAETPAEDGAGGEEDDAGAEYEDHEAAFDGEAAEAESDTASPVVLEGGISVEVTPDQRATVLGDAVSLRAVVGEICRQAGIQLRAFAAPDRPYVGHLENVTISDAFRSMLRSESYFLGFRKEEPAGHTRITWIRVLGGQSSPTAVSAPKAGAPTTTGGRLRPGFGANRFTISPALLFQAFGTLDPQRRDQARQEVIARIEEPDQLTRFLATPPKDLARMFTRYKDAASGLRQLQSMAAERPEVQAKFDEILAEVADVQSDSDNEDKKDGGD